MPHVSLKNVSLDYPIYDSMNRSLLGSIKRGIPVGGLIKQHGGKRTSILALNDVSISFEKGDHVALLGHNGAGKTSMLKLLAGFYEPTSGRISREGSMAALLNMTAGMDENISGYENILLSGVLRGLKRKEILQQVDEIAEFSELGSYLDMPVRLYSQGMILRLAFSICTTTNCDILLMDEWFATGDQNFVEKARARLTEMIFRSGILVFATHSADVARRLCNKAVYLEHGNVLMQGVIEDVLDYQASRISS